MQFPEAAFQGTCFSRKSKQAGRTDGVLTNTPTGSGIVRIKSRGQNRDISADGPPPFHNRRKNYIMVSE
ncbi:MAG TPA: hypothetical protein DEB39_05555 [Planctomycetaceae bacterium]|nr:hypothetical protein [Planctomycetaceae bacterium]